MSRAAVDRLAATIVFGVWAVLFAGLLAYVWSFGNPLPFADDWEFIPYLSGAEPVTFDWLWQQVAEHRHLASKAYLLGLVRLAGGDFRSVILVDALALGALSLVAIRIASRLRGRISLADAFFPLILLNWGLRSYLLLAADGAFHLLPTVLAIVLLLILAAQGSVARLSTGVLVGLLLMVLGLCSAGGILYAAILSVWLVLYARRLHRSPGPGARRDGWVVAALALANFLIVALFFVGYRSSDYGAAASPDLGVKLHVGSAYLAASFGTPIGWRYSGALVGLALLGGAVVLADAVRNRRARAAAACGLAFFMAAVVGLAFAIAWGREAMGVGHSLRYTALAIPTVVSAYFVWGLARPKPLGTIVQSVLCVCALVAAGLNVGAGLEFARGHRAQMAEFERDLQARMPLYELVSKHKQTMVYWGTHDDMAGYVRAARDAGLGPFRRLPPDPAFREIPLPIEPAFSSGIIWNGSIARGTGVGSFVVFRLPEPMDVAGIRLVGSHSNHDNAEFRVVVRPTRGSRAPIPNFHRLSAWPGLSSVGGPFGEPPRPFTIYIAQTIEGFQLYPDDGPFEFSLAEVVLLVPRDAEVPIPPERKE